jgi:hypothetical protein
MKTTLRLNPVQVNIRVLWQRQARRLAKQERIASALEELQSYWLEIADLKFRDHEELDPKMAKEEFELDEHVGRVKILDWIWLARTFTAHDLVDLQLAVCEQCFPKRQCKESGVPS